MEMEKRKKIEDAQIEEEQEQVKNKKKDFKKNVQVCDLALSSCLIKVFLVVCSWKLSSFQNASFKMFLIISW